MAFHRALLPVILALVAAAAIPARASELRDITVTPRSRDAIERFLVTGKVATVVVELKDGNVAQIRMKPITASKAALGSARLRPGVKKIDAFIERKDVLIANVTFASSIASITVIARTADSVVVLVTFGKRKPGKEPQKESPKESSPSAGSSDRPKQSSKTTGDAAPGTPKPAASSRDTDAGATADTSGGRLALHRKKWALTTIVIDAGHGGTDPGAIGLDDVLEKDVTLAVAKQLRREIQKGMPNVNVVMTRDDDTFVELYRRGQIANEKNGRLFISIHCNSMPEKPHPASGYECYILRPGKSEDAARVAAEENGAVHFESNQKKYDGMNTESTIVATMAQSSFARYSEQIAQQIRVAMRGSTGIADRGVLQAGFFVLIGASMPSVLVEIGYLTSETDIEVLKSAAGRKKIAKALFQGIKAYEKIYTKSLR